MSAELDLAKNNFEFSVGEDDSEDLISPTEFGKNSSTPNDDNPD